MLQGEHAYSGLRDRLVTLAIEPGKPIDELALADELGVGRSSVREAIRRLASDGLVTTFPRRGTFASRIVITDLSHICDVRLALEGQAARRAAERSPDLDHTELTGLRDRLATLHALSDPESQIELYQRVHRFLYRAAANPLMHDTLDRYLDLSVRIWRHVSARLNAGNTCLKDHDQILATIADNSPNQARRLIERHVLTFERVVRAGI